MLKFDMPVEFETEAKTTGPPDHSQKCVVMLCVIPKASKSNAWFTEIYRMVVLLPKSDTALWSYGLLNVIFENMT